MESIIREIARAKDEIDLQCIALKVSLYCKKGLLTYEEAEHLQIIIRKIGAYYKEV